MMEDTYGINAVGATPYCREAEYERWRSSCSLIWLLRITFTA